MSENRESPAYTDARMRMEAYAKRALAGKRPLEKPLTPLRDAKTGKTDRYF